MSWTRQIAKLRGILSGQRWRSDLREEMRAHVEMEEQENLEAGMPPEEAHYAALRRFGNVTLAQERSREMWIWNSAETLLQDFRYGLRQLFRHPAFTSVAILSLGIGIATTTGIFSVVDAVIVDPLSFPQPRQLVSVWETLPRFKNQPLPWNPHYYSELVQQTGVFSNISAAMPFTPMFGGASVPQRLVGVRVTPDFFPTLGREPALGRNFLGSEGQRGHNHVAILAYGFWRKRFGGDPSVLGKSLKLDDLEYTVVGILPRAFVFPDVRLVPPDVYVPLTKQLIAKSDGRGGFWVFGRLRPGVTPRNARSALDVLVRHLSPRGREAAVGSGAAVSPVGQEIAQGSERPLLLLFCASCFLLLIACANVASMMVVRLIRRQREIGVRVALGASRRRVVSQMLSEGLLLAFLGCAVGMLGAYWMKDGLLSLFPPGRLPRPGTVPLNLRVFGFAFITSLATGTLFSIAPALRATKLNIEKSLRQGNESSGGTRTLGLRNSLIVGEIGIAILLLIGTGLMLRSLLAMLRTNVGFDIRNLLIVDVTVPTSKNSNAAQVAAFYGNVLDTIRALPGVRAATFAADFVQGGAVTEVRAEGQPLDFMRKAPLVAVNSVAVGYFRTMGITLIRGRVFDAADYVGKPRCAIISRHLSRLLWPDRQPVGERFQIGGPTGRWFTVAGVVGEVRRWGGKEGTASLAMYIPSLQAHMHLVVRTDTSPLSLSNSVRESIWRSQQVVPDRPPLTMMEVRGLYTAETRSEALLFTIFGSVALVLAAGGVYSLSMHLVELRTREIGVRMALGAQKHHVLRLVVGQGMILAFVGVGIGTLGALGLTRFLSTLLYGVKATDPLTFVTVSLVLSGVALLACYIPARRATKVDPMVALRYE